MNAWPERRLGDLVDVLSGFAFESDAFSDAGNLPIVRIRDVVRGRSSTFFRGTFDPKYVVRTGDLLIGMDGEFNRARWNGGDALLNQRVCRIASRSAELDDGYLFHFLPHVLKAIERVTPFVTVKHLSVKQIVDIPIRLPPILHQRRIADILHKADALRAERRSAFEQLDTLTQTIFFEMFGDPMTNPKGLPTRSLADIGEVVTGNTPSRAKPDYFGGTLEWIKSDNLSTGAYFATRAEESLSELGRAVARTAPPNSILVTCIAGSENSIGNAAMTNREVAFNQQINALIPRTSNPHFLFAQMRIGKRLIQRASTASMKGMVSKRRFEEIRFVFPPVADQDRFATAADVSERIRSAQRTSQENLDSLFASLQHRAFRGEL